MSSREERFRELSVAWALGALDPAELEELERLAKDAGPETIRACRELELAASHLAIGVAPEQPPAEVKAHLMARVRSLRTTEPRPERSRTAGLAIRLAAALRLDAPGPALAAAATVIVLAVGLAWSVGVVDRGTAGHAAQIEDLSERLAEHQRLLEVLQARQTELVSLEGTESRQWLYGKLLWDPESQLALLQISNLPPSEDGTTYQLWVYPQEGDPESAGVFSIGASERDILLRVEELTTFERRSVGGFAVTLEPDGGGAEPRGTFMLVGRPSPP